MMNSNTRSRENVVGLIPAAGYSMRLGLIPCSKEIYPIGYHRIQGTREIRPKAVCEYLIESMQSAGIQQIYVVLRKGKWDIPGYLGDGSQFNVDLAYLVMEASAGPIALGKSGLNYPHTWSIAVWGPAFTGFMHEYVASMRKRANGSVRRKPGAAAAEHTVGHVMAAAFHRGLRMDGIVFANGSWIDIGTPSGMMKALRCYGEADGM